MVGLRTRGSGTCTPLGPSGPKGFVTRYFPIQTSFQLFVLPIFPEGPVPFSQGVRPTTACEWAGQGWWAVSGFRDYELAGGPILDLGSVTTECLLSQRIVTKALAGVAHG